MGADMLTEDAVEGMKNDVVPDPTVTQVVALAAAFGVPTSYLLDRSKDPRSSTGSCSTSRPTRPRAR
jgi:hypothetical protein